MKFYLISKSDFSKYESSKPSDTTTKVKASVSAKDDSSTKRFTRAYYKERRDFKRRVDQAVQRYLKRALIQLENWSFSPQQCGP